MHVLLGLKGMGEEKSEGWKKDMMSHKLNIENLKRQRGMKEGKYKRQSMFGSCSFHLQFCKPRNLLRVVPAPKAGFPLGGFFRAQRSGCCF